MKINYSKSVSLLYFNFILIPSYLDDNRKKKVEKLSMYLTNRF